MINMLAKKDVFIFDMDGTIIDSVWIWNQVDACFVKNTAKVNVSEECMGSIREEFLAKVVSDDPYRDYVVHLANLYRIKRNIDELVEYRKELAMEFSREIKLKPYAKELLTLLKKSGKTLVLATAASKNHVRRMLYENPATNFLGEDIFDLVLDQTDVSMLKPAADIHRMSQEVLGYEKDKAIIFEDSYDGLMAAKNAGIDCIVVQEPRSNEQVKLMDNAQYYVDSLENIYFVLIEMNNKINKLR